MAERTRVRKGNVVLTIDPKDLAKRQKEGYRKIDEKGKFIDEPKKGEVISKAQLEAAKKEVPEAVAKELEEVKKENEALKAQIKEAAKK